MTKGIIVALVAAVTSLAVYAGIGNHKTSKTTLSECCKKSNCCPNKTGSNNCCNTMCE